MTAGMSTSQEPAADSARYTLKKARDVGQVGPRGAFALYSWMLPFDTRGLAHLAHGLPLIHSRSDLLSR